MLLAGLRNGKRDDLNLFRKSVSGREIAVALDEHAADNEYRIARRGHLLHSVRHGSLPVGTGNQVVAHLRAGGARPDVGEVDVKRVSELHTVVAAEKVRHVQYLRLFGEVEPAD